MEHIPPTVIKLPLDVTASNANRRIRLRNNIRLNLPSDQISLLHNRPLCLLLALYLGYIMYLHYMLHSHVATLDPTRRHCSEEMQRRGSDLAHTTNLEDLKHSLHSFVQTLRSLKSPGGAITNYDAESDASSSGDEATQYDDYSDSSYEMRLDQDSSEVLKATTGAPVFQDTSDVSRVDILRTSDDSEISEFATEAPVYDERRSKVIFSWSSLLGERSEEETPKSEMSPDEAATLLSVDTVANGSRLSEITLVLPHFEVGESKPRRARDVKSQVRPVKVSILLKGAAPMASIRDGGSVIRPWYLDARANGNLGNSDVSSHFVLQELNGKVQIMRSGLYMVYAQIYYTTSEQMTNVSDTINSYSVIVASSPIAERPIAVCSVHASVNFSSEVSCHLSIVYHLSAGDRVYLVQREPNRSILLKEGYSYFGLSTLRLDE